MAGLPKPTCFKEACSNPADPSGPHAASPQHHNSPRRWLPLTLGTTHEATTSFHLCGFLLPSSPWLGFKLPEGKHWACFLLSSARRRSRPPTLTYCYRSDKHVSKWIKIELPGLFYVPKSRAPASDGWHRRGPGLATWWHKQPWVELGKWFMTSIKNIYVPLVPENFWSHNPFHLKSFPLSFPNERRSVSSLIWNFASINITHVVIQPHSANRSSLIRFHRLLNYTCY